MSKDLWWTITYLGSSSLLLPVCGLVLWGWWFDRGPHTRRGALRFAVALALGVLITLASKVAFLGWGIGVYAWDFTGFSGHAMLAAALLPMLFYSLAGVVRNPTTQPRRLVLVTAVGAALALLVAVSRVVLGAHSVSEVVLGGALGAAVAATGLYAVWPHTVRHVTLYIAPLVLLGALHSPAATFIPGRSMEVRLALALSGHSRPFTRVQWRAQHATPSGSATTPARSTPTTP